MYLYLQPGIPDYKIVLTPENTNAGYATYVEKLLELATEMGLQMNFNTEVTKIIEMSGGGFTLSTKDGRVRPFSVHMRLLNAAVTVVACSLARSSLCSLMYLHLQACEMQRPSKVAVLHTG